MKTLNQVAKALKISRQKAKAIKRKIELESPPSLPNSAIWGKGKKRNYPLRIFKKHLQ